MRWAAVISTCLGVWHLPWPAVSAVLYNITLHHLWLSKCTLSIFGVVNQLQIDYLTSDNLTKNKNSAIIYSPLCGSKPLWLFHFEHKSSCLKNCFVTIEFHLYEQKQTNKQTPKILKITFLKILFSFLAELSL